MGGDSSYPPSSTGSEEFPVGSNISSDDDGFSGVGRVDSLLLEASERQKAKAYSDVMKSYGELQSKVDRLHEAKQKIISYKPGSWTDNNPDNTDSSHSHLPKAATLLLVGPQGAGKSSLVNKISRALDNGVFASRRAQVSCNSSGVGTRFLSEYIIPRGSGSFCLYDTRGLSNDVSENEKMFELWMRSGVRHGVLASRKAKRAGTKALRKVNFVVLVVNALSLLESINTPDGGMVEYAQMISASFHSPWLSFQDDKPVVVVTHGDLLPLEARAWIRVFLGSLLGIPPDSQIFDIPDSEDPATAMAILSMLVYSLERADKHMRSKQRIVPEGLNRARDSLFLLAIAAAVVVLAMLCSAVRLQYTKPSVAVNLDPEVKMFEQRFPARLCPEVEISQQEAKVKAASRMGREVEWSRIRHLWSKMFEQRFPMPTAAGARLCPEVEISQQETPERKAKGKAAARLGREVEWSRIRHLWLGD